MKKTNYHVNPAVNKWEEEQRRARMEKMIQRAKSTLPPEARGGVKPSGPKKPSPYTAENNASKLVRKRSTTGGQGTPSGAAAMDAQELDSLIYNRVQEILGMPLMRRAAAARTASKGGAQTKPPASGRGGRRPAWNDEWSAQAASTPSNHDERHVAGVGSRGGTSNVQYERSPSKSSPAAKPRPSPTQGTSGTPTKGSRIPVPARLEVVASGNNSNNLGGMQRRPSGRAPGAEERVILLPSPSAAAAASRGSAGRPPSSRYGSGAGAGAAAVGDPVAAAGTSGHLLGESVVAAIEALNPQAPAACEAASRIAEHRQQQQQGHQQQGQFCGRSGRGASVAGLGVSGFASGVSGSFRGSSGEVGRAARHLNGSASALGAAGRDASLMQSVTAAAGGSEGGSPGTGASITASSLRRPPLAPAPRASGRGVPQGAHHASHGPKGGEGEGEEEEDAYADDDFEEYEGTDDEGGVRKAEAGQADDNDEDGGSGDACGVEPEVALLRDSVNALNGLVQLKIQQEVARSQQQPLETQQDPPAHRRSSQTGAGPGRRSELGVQRPSAAAAAPDVLASLALVGTEDLDGRGHGLGRGDPANSSLGDGLRQSDLDYLARLGGGEPHDGAEVATSTDERPFVIEPGAPAGTAKAWGDRQPWATVQDADAGATGLKKLRERQERERQQQAAVAHAGGVQQQQQQRLSQHREEEDSVLLGETLSPRNRSGAAAQMHAVSSALAALASSGQLTPEDAQDLRTQTDALYGSLVQLHNLMNGPRGAELCSGSPSSSNGGGGGGAKGFTPVGLSPAHSPSHTARRPPQAAGMAAAGAELSPGKPSAQMRLETVDALHVGKGEEAGGLPRDTGGGDGSQLQQPGRGGGGSHLQLTPKHQLVAEDVAWMAGLVHSLSRSLQVENGEVDLPGV